jgi:hypothetical protein
MNTARLERSKDNLKEQTKTATTVAALKRKMTATLKKRAVVESRFYVAMSEEGYVQRRPVLATLIHLAEAASGVIKLFGD